MIRHAGDGKIRLEIVTPYELLFDGSVDMVIITASMANGYSAGHTAMFAALKDGEIVSGQANDWQVLASSIAMLKSPQRGDYCDQRRRMGR
jgi:F0F1-type ATP synthase epsilon subunit